MKKVSNFKAAMTYANAMYELAAENKQLQEAYHDMRQLEQLDSSTLELLKKTDNPLWKNDDKEKLIKPFAQKIRLHSDSVNMLKLLAANNKMFLLPRISEQFIRLYHQKHNIAEVLVTTVIQPSAKQEKNLIKKLTAVFGKNISLKYIIDPDIIGGLIIQYDTYLIDMSVRHKLNSLEQIMKGSK